MVIILATDGSALKNGSKFNCAAGYYYKIYDGEKQDDDYGVETMVATNNQAEFIGVINGLKAIKSKKYDQEGHIIIITDSQYLINCITVWYDIWKSEENITKKHPHNSKKELVKNWDLIKELHELFFSLEKGGRFLKIKSHIRTEHLPNAYYRFKTDNGYPCSYDLFLQFRQLNELVDHMVVEAARRM